MKDFLETPEIRIKKLEAEVLVLQNKVDFWRRHAIAATVALQKELEQKKQSLQQTIRRLNQVQYGWRKERLDVPINAAAEPKPVAEHVNAEHKQRKS